MAPNEPRRKADQDEDRRDEQQVDASGTPRGAGKEEEREIHRPLRGEQHPGDVAVRAAAVRKDESEHQAGEDRRQIEVIARAARHDDGARQGHEEPAVALRLVELPHGAEKEMEEHSARDPHGDIDHRPFGGRRRPDVRRHFSLMIDRKQEPEGDDRHQRVDPCRQSKHRKDPVSAAGAVHIGVHRGGGAQRRHRGQRTTLHRGVGPCVTGEKMEDREHGAESDGEGGDGLGKGDLQMDGRDQRERRQTEIRAQLHAEPTEREAHDRREILDLPRAQQPGDAGPEYAADEHVLRAAHITVAGAEPVEEEIREDVADGDDRERGQGGLHGVDATSRVIAGPAW